MTEWIPGQVSHSPRQAASIRYPRLDGLVRSRRLWLNDWMFEIDQLACLRGDRLLFRKLCCTLDAGSLLRITGANGAGKTSLLRMLCGLAEPAAGEIRWQGVNIRRQGDAFHAALTYLGHAVALNDLLTPLENLRFACQTAGTPCSNRAGREILANMGLAAQLDLPCRVLSQGQRRRVALARLALGAQRPLWILDEPFTALDQSAVETLAGHFGRHCAGGGIVVFTSHQEVGFSHPLQRLNVEDFAP